MAVIPCGHRLVLKPSKLEEVDDVYKQARISGIVIPDSRDRVREEQSVDQGTVLAVGTSAFKDYGTPAWCEVGDTVVYARHAGKFIPDPETNEYVLVVNDEDICAVIRK